MILTVNLNASIDKRYVADQCREGEVNRVVSCTNTAGGKGLNVARVAVMLGEPVMAAGILRGHSGQFIAEQIARQEILNCCIQASGENRCCINILDLSTGKQTEYLEPGEPVSPKDGERFLESFGRLLKQTDAVVISGSAAPGIGKEMYAEMVRMAKDAKVPVLVDASGEFLKSAAEEGPDLIKPNRDEIQAYAGRKLEKEEEFIDAGRKLLEKGVGTVVISLGSEGSLVMNARRVYRVESPKVASVNTVGCGDAMTAGFAVGTARGMDEEEMVRLASAAAAANAADERTGYADWKLVKELMPEVRVTEICLR
ncbi:1-phosphofructokinase [Clostridium sp. chh4-2]|uniref:1-phosphofructokinase family hexose kinase n=1 Tax=Clostridium sp. chh4-2 TaxID=2067550 RepID=UPI000CCDBE7C|nr:1-phosphofructokinase family hexose kinase [Clostridium sp. chh4-2]PNV60173.1 1-phosphofructokinase [Clostridium sp. chh4-2]